MGADVCSVLEIHPRRLVRLRHCRFRHQPARYQPGYVLTSLTVPWALRVRLSVDRRLLSDVLSSFLRPIFAWQRIPDGFFVPVPGREELAFAASCTSGAVGGGGDVRCCEFSEFAGFRAESGVLFGRRGERIAGTRAGRRTRERAEHPGAEPCSESALGGGGGGRFGRGRVESRVRWGSAGIPREGIRYPWRVGEAKTQFVFPTRNR